MLAAIDSAEVREMTWGGEAVRGGCWPEIIIAAVWRWEARWRDERPPPGNTSIGTPVDRMTGGMES